MIYTKIGSYVSFPLVDLDMTPFVHKGCPSFIRVLRSNVCSLADCRNKVRSYDLFSCIVHYGRAGSGHYVTYALNELNQQWYEYDDDTVRQVEPSTVQNAEAYVLFYRSEDRSKMHLKMGFFVCRKKEANISEAYETIRHLLSRDQVRVHR